MCSASSNNQATAGNSKEDENELPAEYLNSALAKESQVSNNNGKHFFLNIYLLSKNVQF